MEMKTGDQVLVNLAPFIGSPTACRDRVSCVVLDVVGDQVHVRTEPPYREVALWVDLLWIEGKAKRKTVRPSLVAASGRGSADTW